MALSIEQREHPIAMPTLLVAISVIDARADL
jgi:hypothetical protein